MRRGEGGPHLFRMAFNFATRYEALLKFSGARYEGRFVYAPGVRVMSSTRLEGEGEGGALPFCAPSDDFVRGGEFRARLCYLAFREDETEEDARAYVSRMIHGHGHLSVWNAHYVEFFVCGISTEAVLELCAHREASCSRLTTSNSKSRADAFYRIVPGTKDEVEAQEAFLRAWMERERPKEGAVTTEQRNMLDLGVKCGAMTFCMSLKDYVRFLEGRLPEAGNETEVREVAHMMLRELYGRYPALFGRLRERWPETRDSMNFTASAS